MSDPIGYEFGGSDFPDEVTTVRDSNSVTVCTCDDLVNNGDHYCPIHGTFAKAAPAEQPRPEPNSLSIQKRKHVMSGGKMSEFKPEPVAASPAEGPRQVTFDEFWARTNNSNYFSIREIDIATLKQVASEAWNAAKAQLSAAHPSPAAAKVEEIAQEIAKTLHVLYTDGWEKIAAILRPYFPEEKG